MYIVSGIPDQEELRSPNSISDLSLAPRAVYVFRRALSTVFYPKKPPFRAFAAPSAPPPPLLRRYIWDMAYNLVSSGRNFADIGTPNFGPCGALSWDIRFGEQPGSSPNGTDIEDDGSTRVVINFKLVALFGIHAASGK